MLKIINSEKYQRSKLIKKDGTFSTVNLFPKKISKEYVSMNIALEENGDISGKCRTTYTDYDAYLFRNQNTTITEDKYLEKLEIITKEWKFLNML